MLRLLLWLNGLLAMVAGSDVQADPSKPNIIYIICDELSYFGPSFMGSKELQTPNMDRLAASGVIMKNVLSGGPNCAPARCALLTGKHTGHASIRGNSPDDSIRAEEKTIAEVLKPQGYAVGGFGKWGIGGRDSTGAPEKHGFDVFFGYYDQAHAHTYYPPYLMQAYMASISFADWVVGQILDALDASPYAKNTIVILWSDNGYHIGEKERLHKRALWSQTSRIPFMISVPGMATAGQNCAAPVNLLDLYPTLNEICNLDQKVPQKLAGHSIAPLLKDPGQAWAYVSLTSHDVGNAAVTDARYHYIRYADGAEELYDHQKDPREYENLANQPELKPVIKRLAASLPQSWIPEGRKKGGKGGDADE